MPKHTLDLVKKRMKFVAKYSAHGSKVIIIVQKVHHAAISKLKNPLHVTIEEY